MASAHVRVEPSRYREIDGMVELRPGQVWRHRLHGTEATYRILEPPVDGLVRVRVVEAPGLSAGFELKLTTTALRAMEFAGDCADEAGCEPSATHGAAHLTAGPMRRGS
jgi:hypothetical protein